MARKPVHLKPAGRRTTGREYIWAAIRELAAQNRCFTVTDIERSTGQPSQTVRTYLQGLDKAGYLESIDANNQPAAWQLIKDVGVDAPRVTKDGNQVTQGRGRENMWRTMKILKEFNYVDLAIHASTEQHPVKPLEARDYINYLHKAGYLVCVKQSRPGSTTTTGCKARYRFLKSKNTGPKPPMIQRVKHVYDANLGEVVWPVAGGEA